MTRCSSVNGVDIDDLLENSVSPQADSTIAESAEESSYGTRIALRSVRVVANYLPFIESTRTKITTEMEAMILSGLVDVVRRLPSKLAID